MLELGGGIFSSSFHVLFFLFSLLFDSRGLVLKLHGLGGIQRPPSLLDLERVTCYRVTCATFKVGNKSRCPILLFLLHQRSHLLSSRM
jgi:hypothetical protein